VDLAAAACVVVGAAYEALENRGRAVAWLVRALRVDFTCAEALALLVDRRLLSFDDEKALLAEARASLRGDDVAWVAAVFFTPRGRHSPARAEGMRRYGARLCVHDPDPAGDDARFAALERDHGLGDNAEVRRARAERKYYQHDCRGAHALARAAHREDPYDFACVPAYLASLVELGLKHELFYAAHELARAYPGHACSWFAVGCYYLLVKKNDAAQRYFHKAAKLAPRFAPAWVGFGNAFAAQDESEQARHRVVTSSACVAASRRLGRGDAAAPRGFEAPPAGHGGLPHGLAPLPGVPRAADVHRDGVLHRVALSTSARVGAPRPRTRRSLDARRGSRVHVCRRRGARENGLRDERGGRRGPSAGQGVVGESERGFSIVFGAACGCFQGREVRWQETI